MNLAAPLIPGPFSQISVLEWRVKLLKKHKVINVTELLEDLEKAKEQKLSKAKVSNWLKLVTSDLLPTETEKTILAAVLWLIASPEMPDRAVLSFKPSLIKSYQSCKSDAEFSRKFSKEIELARKEINEVVLIHMETSVPMIRAKLAAIEIISNLGYHTVLPLLIAETPRYLKCPSVNAWFEEIQTHSLYGKDAQKENANETLKATLKALAVDRNKLKSKIYQKWHIYFQFERIKEYLDEDLREDGITTPESKAYFEKFCQDFKLSKEVQRRALSKSISAKEVAIDILINKKMIASATALNKIILEINSIKDRHSTLLHLPGTKTFLDLPTHNPSELASHNLWDLLEMVTL